MDICIQNAREFIDSFSITYWCGDNVPLINICFDKQLNNLAKMNAICPTPTMASSETETNQCSTIMNWNPWQIESHKSLVWIQHLVYWDTSKHNTYREWEWKKCRKKISKFSLTTFNKDFYIYKIIFGSFRSNPVKKHAKKKQHINKTRNSLQFNGKHIQTKLT